jgi:hypothetical protein
MVSVTALRDAQDDIIGYLLIGTDNTARKQIECRAPHPQRAAPLTPCSTLQEKNVELQAGPRPRRRRRTSRSPSSSRA